MKLVKIFPVFFTIRELVTCSQDPHTDPYPEPYVNSLHHPIPLKVLLTLRLLMSYIYIYIYIYIYGAPILDVPRSHTTTSDQLVAETST